MQRSERISKSFRISVWKQSGAPERGNLEPFEADKVLSALEDWSEVLRADPEISRKLAAFSEAAEDVPTQDTGVLPPPPELSP